MDTRGPTGSLKDQKELQLIRRTDCPREGLQMTSWYSRRPSRTPEGHLGLSKLHFASGASKGWRCSYASRPMVLAKEVRMGLEVSESQMEGNRSGLWQSSALPAERPQKCCNNLGQESFLFSVSASLEVDKKILKNQKLETEG